MVSEGYVLVQWRSDGTWFHGCDGDVPVWKRTKKGAMRFDSASKFREFERQTVRYAVKYPWHSDRLRFVRVRPRKEAA